MDPGRFPHLTQQLWWDRKPFKLTVSPVTMYPEGDGSKKNPGEVLAPPSICGEDTLRQEITGGGVGGVYGNVRGIIPSTKSTQNLSLTKEQGLRPVDLTVCSKGGGEEGTPGRGGLGIRRGSGRRTCRRIRTPDLRWDRQ